MSSCRRPALTPRRRSTAGTWAPRSARETSVTGTATINLLPVVGRHACPLTSTSRSHLALTSSLVRVKRAVPALLREGRRHDDDQHAGANVLRQVRGHRERGGRVVHAKWSWIVPALSAGPSPCFHKETGRTSTAAHLTARNPTPEIRTRAGGGGPAHPVTAPGVTFWFLRKRFRGSYAALNARSRSYFSRVGAPPRTRSDRRSSSLSSTYTQSPPSRRSRGIVELAASPRHARRIASDGRSISCSLSSSTNSTSRCG